MIHEVPNVSCSCGIPKCTEPREIAIPEFVTALLSVLDAVAFAK